MSAVNHADGSDRTFEDTLKDAWYSDDLAWAEKNEIIFGVDPTHFEPDTHVSRQDAATIFCRFAKYEQKDTSQTADLSGYKDAYQIDDYALPAMHFCVANGVITGNDDGSLAPLAV